MCGITGFVGDGSEDNLRAMIATIRHRGPDDTGVWREGPVALAHARLAIIDLSPGGHQPMRDASGRYTVVFNGEVYNYKSLRAELAGYPFKTQCDTEIILAAYSRWGVEAFKKMDGMFALALWDAREHELVLVRDRLGKKPLYWSFQNGLFLFGSELKALLAHPGCPRALDHRSLAHYLAREYVPTPRTIYKDIQKLPPASVLRFRDDTVQIEPFWNPAIGAPAMSETDALAHFDSLLQHATNERMVADVPLGVFLSGGIDSSTVAYYAARASAQKVKTFSIGFSEKSFDESPQARLVAKHLGTEHHERILLGKDALALVQDIPQVFDEPVADASVLPTLLLSRFTREHVTVALGGDGADELLLGYPTFQAEHYAWLYARVPETLRALLRRSIDLLPASTGYLGLDFKARKFTHDFAGDPMVRHLQWLGSFKEDELNALLSPAVVKDASGINDELIAQWREECPQLTGLNALSHLYMRTYLMDQVLVKVDRASMRYALEVRAPFLAHDIVEFLLALPPEMKYKNGRGKYLLRRLMRDKLPGEIVDQKKKGFAAPVSQWLRSELRDLVTDALSADNVQKSGLFQVAEVSRLLREHLAGSRNHGKKLWTLLVFQLWHDRWNG